MKLGNVVRVRVLLFAVRSVCGVWLPVAHGGSFKASLTKSFLLTKTVSTMISNFTIPKILNFFFPIRYPLGDGAQATYVDVHTRYRARC